MTLIAKFTSDGWPAFLSDRLLSSPVGTSGLYLPGSGKLHEHLQPRNRPHGLACKTEIIGKSTICAWAGNVAACKRLSDAIRKFVTEITPDTGYLEKHLRANYAEDLKPESARLLVASLMEDGRIGVWSNACREYRSPDMVVWATGSGIPLLERHLASLAHLPSSAMPSYRRVVFAALHVAGGLLGEEIRTGNPLLEGVGGAYDIAAFDDGVPCFVDDVLYVFWHITETETGFTITPPFRVLKVLRFANEHRAIYSAQLVSKAEGEVSIEEETYNVEDLRAAAAIKERRDEDLATVWQVNVLIVTGRDGKVRMTSGVSCQPTKQGHPVETWREGGERGMEITSPEFIVSALNRMSPHTEPPLA